jgi:hypothetical protein
MDLAALRQCWLQGLENDWVTEQEEIEAKAAVKRSEIEAKYTADLNALQERKRVLMQTVDMERDAQLTEFAKARGLQLDMIRAMKRMAQQKQTEAAAGSWLWPSSWFGSSGGESNPTPTLAAPLTRLR